MTASRLLLATAAVLTTLSTGALADTIDNRQANQAERIQAAARAGQLSRHEAAALRTEQARIAELERRVKADGIVTRREAAMMDHVQDRANRNIYRESHDADKGRSYFRRWW